MGGVPAPLDPRQCYIAHPIPRGETTISPGDFKDLFNQFKTQTLPEKDWAGRGVLTLIIN